MYTLEHTLVRHIRRIHCWLLSGDVKCERSIDIRGVGVADTTIDNTHQFIGLLEVVWRPYQGQKRSGNNTFTKLMKVSGIYYSHGIHMVYYDIVFYAKTAT